MGERNNNTYLHSFVYLYISRPQNRFEKEFSQLSVFETSTKSVFVY